MPEKKTIAVDSGIHSRFAEAVRHRHGSTYKHLGLEAEKALEEHARKLLAVNPA